ncbi:unnamed protein product [Vitrella brassicaformis CCMP3155]|uniref:Uncharacterized protein n=1 Tax=Vitrella brassicaformis (strain CCMP3155) TaxID=1169540 RepID=A0A0G4EVV1_VITBC|nr:unnamed protein product [Vitrella brassicaformis CCMP3155]|eukprot:CEM02557.1 unnamed protein product [Vitrella brassicaformis CCMP3155]
MSHTNPFEAAGCTLARGEIMVEVRHVSYSRTLLPCGTRTDEATASAAHLDRCQPKPTRFAALAIGRVCGCGQDVKGISEGEHVIGYLPFSHTDAAAVAANSRIKIPYWMAVRWSSRADDDSHARVVAAALSPLVESLYCVSHFVRPQPEDIILVVATQMNWRLRCLLQWLILRGPHLSIILAIPAEEFPRLGIAPPPPPPATHLSHLPNGTSPPDYHGDTAVTLDARAALQLKPPKVKLPSPYASAVQGAPEGAANKGGSPTHSRNNSSSSTDACQAKVCVLQEGFSEQVLALTGGMGAHTILQLDSPPTDTTTQQPREHGGGTVEAYARTCSGGAAGMGAGESRFVRELLACAAPLGRVIMSTPLSQMDPVECEALYLKSLSLSFFVPHLPLLTNTHNSLSMHVLARVLEAIEHGEVWMPSADEVAGTAEG